MADIGRNLATLLGGNDVNRFSLDGRSYKVIPQAERLFRLDPEMLGDFYLRSASGVQVPLSSLVRIERAVEPSKRTQFQQLNAVTIEGLMAPGVSEGQAMAAMEQIAREGAAAMYTGALAAAIGLVALVGTDPIFDEEKMDAFEVRFEIGRASCRERV